MALRPFDYFTPHHIDHFFKRGQLLKRLRFWRRRSVASASTQPNLTHLLGIRIGEIFVEDQIIRHLISISFNLWIESEVTVTELKL